MTDTPDDNKQQQIEEAAEGIYFWENKRLNPFSFDRQAAWERLGMNNAESELETCVAIVYLCLLGEEIVEGTTTGIDLFENARGPEKRKLFIRRMSQWAESQGIGGNTSAGVECQKLGFRIWNDSKVSRFAPESKGAASPNG